jgi:hypothetical protein
MTKCSFSPINFQGAAQTGAKSLGRRVRLIGRFLTYSNISQYLGIRLILFASDAFPRKTTRPSPPKFQSQQVKDSGEVMKPLKPSRRGTNAVFDHHRVSTMPNHPKQSLEGSSDPPLSSLSLLAEKAKSIGRLRWKVYMFV